MDTTDTYRQEDIKRMIIDHFQAIRANRLYRDAFIYVYFEANMGWTLADDMRSLLMGTRSLSPLKFVSRDTSSEQRPGVLTRHAEKIMYHQALGRILHKNRLFYAKDTIGATLDEDRVKLVDQLTVYRQETKPPADPAHGKSRVTFTGKAHGVKDDLAMTLQICVYHLGYEEKTLDYRRMAMARGWVEQVG